MTCNCRVCGTDLYATNWYPSQRSRNSRICKQCVGKRDAAWKKANPDKRKAIYTRYHRKIGKLPLNENKECSAYLGVCITEGLVGRAFDGIIPTSYATPGYDFVCNKGKIDVKGGCLRNDGRWLFHIRHNTVADYFLCMAFYTRTPHTLMHAWLLPGSEFNHLESATIRPSTIHNWDEYKLDITTFPAIQ